jgi:RNA methyltransferase, TrmH family
VITLDEVLRLRDKSARERQQRLFVEGVRFLITAVDSGAQLDALVVVPSRLVSPVAQMIVRRLKRQGVPILSLTPDEFARLSLLGEPQGVGAVIKQRWASLTQVAQPKRDALWLSLDEVRSPGNLGTLLRTCDAVGARGLLCSPHVDPYDPSTVRATMGSLFSQRLVRASARELTPFKKHYAFVGAAPDAPHDYRAPRYDRPVVLVLGSERHGLSPDQRSLCDTLVRIPMVGRCDSLNLAIAASVLLYEIHNQRHPH